MVRIKLPKSAVEHIKVLVGKVVSDLIDVILRVNREQSFDEVRVLKVSIGYLSIVILVETKEDPHHNCICISILKLRRRLQKFKPWV